MLHPLTQTASNSQGHKWATSETQQVGDEDPLTGQNRTGIKMKNFYNLMSWLVMEDQGCLTAEGLTAQKGLAVMLEVLRVQFA